VPIKMFNFLYFAFILLFPFYFFSSGQPQISHMVLIAIFGLVFLLFLQKFLNLVVRYKIFMIFLIYIIYVNTSWLMVTYNTSFIINSLFYIFNILLVYSTYLLYEEGFISNKSLRNAVFFTLLLQFTLLMAMSGFNLNSRNILYFNNPNQLGYFAIAILNFYFILSVNKVEHHENNKLTFLMDMGVYFMALVLVLSSSSKSSIISYLLILILLLYVVLIQRATYSKTFIGFIVGILFVAVSMYHLDTIVKLVENMAMFNRLENMGNQSDDSLSGRGYDRIFKYAQYVFLGAGEGMNSRFAASGHHGELHSTAANILFSYGAVGFTLFLALFINVKFQIMRVLFYISPIMLYGLAHNGIRSPLFWMVLALSLLYSTKENNVSIVKTTD